MKMPVSEPIYMQGHSTDKDFAHIMLIRESQAVRARSLCILSDLLCTPAPATQPSVLHRTGSAALVQQRGKQEHLPRVAEGAERKFSQLLAPSTLGRKDEHLAALTITERCTIIISEWDLRKKMTHSQQSTMRP